MIKEKVFDSRKSANDFAAKVNGKVNKEVRDGKEKQVVTYESTKGYKGDKQELYTGGDSIRQKDTGEEAYERW